jgi:hypothetical protein
MNQATRPRRALREIAAVAAGLFTFVPIAMALATMLTPRNWRLPAEGYIACRSNCGCHMGECQGSGCGWLGQACRDRLTNQLCACVCQSEGGCPKCSLSCGLG